MAQEAKQTCFVISPIGEDGSDVRKRADQILKHVIKPAAEACGYDPIRADQISEPGIITSQVIQHIVDDPLIIADLTGRNPNVFYELAIRHAIRKPLVQIIQKGEKMPFDVAGMRTVNVDHQDLDSVEEAKQEIQKQIKAIADKKPEDIESPISFSLELQSLRSSENPEERSVADFVAAVSDLRSDIATIEKQLSSPEKLFPREYIRSVMDMSHLGSRKVRMIFEELWDRANRVLSLTVREGKGATEEMKELEMEAHRIKQMLMMLRTELEE